MNSLPIVANINNVTVNCDTINHLCAPDSLSRGNIIYRMLNLDARRHDDNVIFIKNHTMSFVELDTCVLSIYKYIGVTGDIKLLNYITTTYSSMMDRLSCSEADCIREVFMSAAENNHITLLELFIDKIDIEMFRTRYMRTIEKAALRGHVLVLKFLFDSLPLTIDDIRGQNNSLITSIGIFGWGTSLKYILDRFPLTINDLYGTLHYASIYGHTHIVKLIHDRFTLTSDHNAKIVRLATLNRHTELLKFMAIQSIICL